MTVLSNGDLLYSVIWLWKRDEKNKTNTLTIGRLRRKYTGQEGLISILIVIFKNKVS